MQPKPAGGDVIVRRFQPGDEAAFLELNESWISALFHMEEKDREVLGDPVTHILAPGGDILMAIMGDRAVGCCALLAMPDGGFEVAKMTVSETCRGLGIGRKLLLRAIERARERGAHRLYLETNGKLSDALHLYTSLGFRHLPEERVHVSPYARSDTYMELLLNG